MNRKFIVLLAALLMVAVSSNGQVFIADDEFEGMLRREEPEYALFVFNQGYDADFSYVPVGSGALVLTCLGGAYLLAKRKKRK